MRVELYGCPWEGGVAAYSMPQGDKRGTAYEFYDWTYDGEWRGSQLVNGLGLLTDGDYGPENFKLAYYAKSELHSQGDHSGCDKPPVDTKTNVAF